MYAKQSEGNINRKKKFSAKENLLKKIITRTEDPIPELLLFDFLHINSSQVETNVLE